MSVKEIERKRGYSNASGAKRLRELELKSGKLKQLLAMAH